MVANIYFAVKVASAAFIFYHLWIFIFGEKVLGVWGKLYRWARITRIKLWSHRKRCAEKKARNARRKAIFAKGLPGKRTPQAVEEQQSGVPDTNVEKTAIEPTGKKVEMLQTPFNEDDVIGKTNIVYLEDPEIARKIPTHSEPLTKEPIEEDEEINPDDVVHESQGLTDEERAELMAQADCEPDSDFNTALTYDDINNVAEVLASNSTDEQTMIHAANTIRYKMAGTDILTFLEKEAGFKHKIDTLLDEGFSKNLPKKNHGKKEKKTFDIMEYI